MPPYTLDDALADLDRMVAGWRAAEAEARQHDDPFTALVTSAKADALEQFARHLRHTRVEAAAIHARLHLKVMS